MPVIARPWARRSRWPMSTTISSNSVSLFSKYQYTRPLATPAAAAMSIIRVSS